MEAVESWYDARINHSINNAGDANPDAKLIATAIMTAGMFVAEALSHALDEQRDTETVQSALGDLASAVERIAEQYECNS